MSKHTPGPWEVDPYEPANIIDAESARIAVMVGDDDDPEQAVERNANARLIAAAPTMLEALEAAVDCGLVPVSSVSDGGGAKHSRQVQVADQIRAAIAAAKGEAP